MISNENFGKMRGDYSENSSNFQKSNFSSLKVKYKSQHKLYGFVRQENHLINNSKRQQPDNSKIESDHKSIDKEL